MGDVFVMLYPDVGYLFGRVVGVDLPEPMPGNDLIYVYDVRSEEPRIEAGLLRVDRLLIPPQFVNRLGWSRGYFQTIDHWNVDDEESPERFCFLDPSRGTYRTFGGRLLPGRAEPCGMWAMGNYLFLDNAISEALGIPRAPDDGDEDAVEGPAVLIHIPAPSGGDELALERVEDVIIDALESSGCSGEFDGHVNGIDEAVLYVYGDDVDAVCNVVMDALQNVHLPVGSYAVKHFGGDQAGKERLELDR